MSYRGFPPPPGGQQQGGFAPPPPGAGNFPPPPGGAGNFPPPNQQQPPPPQQQQQHPMMNRPGGNFAPPPPPPNMSAVQTSMSQMNVGRGPPPPPANTMMQPPPHGVTAFRGTAPPPPAAEGAPKMFQPPPPRVAPPPPQQPPMMAVNPPGAGFYQQPPSQSKAPAAPPGAVPPGTAPGQPAPVFQENVDLSIQASETCLRLSAKKLPNAANVSGKIPLGGILRPLAPLAPGEPEIDLVQPGAAGIVRCKRCRTYMNPFVMWLENGRRWRCNICAQLNDCPSAYFCHLDQNGNRRDKSERPELCKAIMEYNAPSEYMVRTPQAPAYFFVIDVSASAVRSGMLQSAANAIRKSLDDLPGEPRTMIGFITYDNSVHYYNLESGLTNPKMMVVADLKELFVPAPHDLLVNLQDSREVVESFLDNLTAMWAKNKVSQSCLGPALKAAYTVTKAIGGKMSVFQCILPTLGDGALRQREDVRQMGTPGEVTLLRPDVVWYKDTAIEFSRSQISVDLYLFPYQYIDCAALCDLPRYTAGTLRSYVGFDPVKDGPRFEGDLHKALTQHTAFEAVMRIRCSKGMRISNFYGNFFIRGTDLMALPNCNSDSVFAFDMVHDDQSLATNIVTLQSALLYTSSEGERRIRVITQAVPVTSLSSEVLQSVDTEAMCNLLAKQALEMSLKTNLDNARSRLQQSCADIMRIAKEGDKRTVSGYSVPTPHGGEGEDHKDAPDSLKLFPLYTLALLKNVSFRGGTDVHPDERVQAHQTLRNMYVTDSTHFIYPRMFSIHDMGADVGRPAPEGTSGREDNTTAGRSSILLPHKVNLSVDRLTSDGIFLLDDGVDMFIWVGRSVQPNACASLFGVQSLEQVDMSQVKLLTEGNDLAERLQGITRALREDIADCYVIPPKITIVREGDHAVEARFFWHLIEDRASFNGGTYSYSEFMDFIAAGGAPGGPPGAPGGMGGQRGAPPAPGRGMPPPPGAGMTPRTGQPGGMPPPPGPPGGMPPPAGPPGGMPPPPGPPMGMAPPPQGGPKPGGFAPPPPQQSQMAPRSAPPMPGSYGGPPPPGGAPPGRSAPPPGPPMGGPPPPQQQMGRGPPPPPGGGSYGGGPPPQSWGGFPPSQQGAPPPPPGGRPHQPPPPRAGGMPPPPPPAYR